MTNTTTTSVAHTSADLTAERLDALCDLIPEAFTEGKVDFDKLRAALGDLVDNRPERYSFTWAGKRDAIRLLQTPTRATLVPAKDESVNWDTTQNLFIEGDNLEVLKLLYKAYYGRVKLIYIDPPYNTGNDFIYPDDYTDPLRPYLQLTGQMDAAGNLLTSNTEASGRYHSAWLNMMYPRLFVGRQLLTDDGSIWISVDDTELPNLRMVCNEIFGEENFVSGFVWEKRTTRENRKVFSTNHDYILCYARDKNLFQESRSLLPMSQDTLNRYSNPDNDPRGPWQSVSLAAQAGHATPAQFYTIVTPSGRKLDPPPGNCWRVTSKRLNELIEDYRIWFGANGDNVPRRKVFLSEASDGLTPHTLWKAEEVGTTDTAKKELNSLFGGESYFETPKPTALIDRIVQIGSSPNDGDIILDFFAGSATVAESTLKSNHNSGGNRKFLLVQLPEPTPVSSSAEQHGYRTISSIGSERVRRVLSQVQHDHNQKLDFVGQEKRENNGFRVFKLASSHFTDWSGTASATPADYHRQLEVFTDPLTQRHDAEAVIWEVAIKEGYSLTSWVEAAAAAGHVVYRVSDPDRGQHFHICLDDEVAPALAAALGLGKEDLFVCRDLALDDSAAANLALQCRLKTI